MALKPFLAHELQQLSMLATRRTFQDFLANKNTSHIKHPSETIKEWSGLELPHALADPHLARLGRGLCERCCSAEGDENGEEQKELHPDAGCLAFGQLMEYYQSLYKDSQVSVPQRVSQVQHTYDTFLHCVRFSTKVTQVELIFIAHRGYCWLVYVLRSFALNLW